MAIEQPRVYGAYVQAWVWVCTEGHQDRYSDDSFRAWARERFQVDGQLEIDDDAKVSRGDKEE